eukprot:jgi/Bigna1/72877/fgenesh1_pg.21_\
MLATPTASSSRVSILGVIDLLAREGWLDILDAGRLNGVSKRLSQILAKAIRESPVSPFRGTMDVSMLNPTSLSQLFRSKAFGGKWGCNGVVFHGPDSQFLGWKMDRIDLSLEDWEGLVENCPNLSSLVLPSMLHDQELRCILNGYSGTLKSIVIPDGSKISSKSFELLQNCLNIQRLKMWFFCDRRDDCFLETLKALDLLEVLDLEYCHVREGTVRSVIPTMPRLRDLRLPGGCSDSDILSLAHIEKSLKSLSFSWVSRDCLNKGYSAISTVLRRMTALENIEFRGWTGVNDKILEILALKCGKLLRSLNVQHASKLTRRAVEHFLSACPNLSNLELMHIKYMDVDVLCSILKCKSLTNVNLGWDPPSLLHTGRRLAKFISECTPKMLLRRKAGTRKIFLTIQGWPARLRWINNVIKECPNISVTFNPNYAESSCMVEAKNEEEFLDLAQICDNHHNETKVIKSTGSSIASDEIKDDEVALKPKKEK